MKPAEAARIFKALACEQRLKVLAMIREMSTRTPEEEGATRVFSRCCEQLDLSPSTVSHHLKELAAAGLITTEKRGQCGCCQFNERLWSKLKAFLG